MAEDSRLNLNWLWNRALNRHFLVAHPALIDAMSRF